MPRAWPEALRWQLAQPVMASLGVKVSAEFEAALKPIPKEKLKTGGVQAGKSYSDALEILLDRPLWLAYPRQWRYWEIVPSYEAEHTEFDYLVSWTAQLGIQSGANTPKNGSCSLSLYNGRVVIETKTAQNIAAIAGQPCDGVLVVEAGQQPEGVRTAALERTMTRNGWIVESGTLEDDENKPRWAWYGERAQEWLGNGPGMDNRAFSLPSWANRRAFPGGEHDPKIEHLRQQLDEHTFNRRIAAKPTGVQNPIYPQVSKPLLLPMPPGLKWVDGAGGIDFGTNHPSSLTAVTLADNNDAWVRANVFLPGTALHSTDAADSGLIQQHRERLAQAFTIWRWGTDPNERHTANLMGAEAVSGSQGARRGRIGLVTARLNGTRGRLLFDANGEGVPELYHEMGRVRYIKSPSGELVVWRVNDDRTASLEDAIEVLDSGIILPQSWGTTAEPDGGAPLTKAQQMVRDWFPTPTPKAPEGYGQRRGSAGQSLADFGGRRSRD